MILLRDGQTGSGGPGTRHIKAAHSTIAHKLTRHYSARMTSRITPTLLELFPEETRPKAQSLVQKYHDDPNMVHLVKELSSEYPYYLDLFARGITHLPATTEEGGSPSVSAYFFLLSEIESLPEKARSFALNASIYAGGAYAHDPSYHAFGLNARTVFKEVVWPALGGPR